MTQPTTQSTNLFKPTTNTNTPSSTGAFSFGSPNFSFGNANKAQAPPEPVKIPEDLKGRSINDILEKIDKSLQIQSESFQRQARQIARWDRMIYDCRELIIHLEDQLMHTDSAQQQLKKDANNLLDLQNTFIEKMKTRTSQTSHISAPEDQRDRIYRHAQRLSNKYSDMETQLKEMVEKIEKARHLSEVSSDMDKISKITNCHMHSLQWIANQCDDLDKKIEKLSNYLSKNELK